MKRMLVMLLALCSLPTTAHAQEAISFDDALERATSRPVQQAAEADVRAAEAGAVASWRAAWLPTLGASAEAIWRTEEVAISTPIGDFVQLPGDQFQAGAELRQPLFSPQGWFADAAAARVDALAADAQRAFAEREVRRQAAAAYLAVLDVRAQREALGPLVQALEAQKARVEALVDAGRTTRDDLLRTAVALDQARLAERDLERTERVAKLALGRAVGASGAVDAAQVPTLGNASLERRQREDLVALERVAEAARKRKAGVLWSWAPRLDLVGRWAYTNQEGLNADNWFEGGFSLTWTPFESGTRPARAKLLESRAMAADARRVEAERGLDVLLAQAEARSETAQDRWKVGKASLAQAEEAARILRERYEAGSALVAEVLDAEADVFARRTQVVRSEIDIVRADVARRFALGTL